jgi:hypothetical protein
VLAQHKFIKDSADARVAREVEEKELKRKYAIKKKEQATSENVENQSEPTSPAASESKHKNNDLVLDGNSSSSTLLDTDATIIEGGGYEGLDLNPEHKSLCDFYKGD